MGTLQQQIASKFIEKIVASKEMDDTKIKQLKNLLENNTRPKIDDLVKIFSLPAGEEVR